MDIINTLMANGVVQFFGVLIPTILTMMFFLVVSRSLFAVLVVVVFVCTCVFSNSDIVLNYLVPTFNVSIYISIFIIDILAVVMLVSGVFSLWTETLSEGEGRSEQYLLTIFMLFVFAVLPVIVTLGGYGYVSERSDEIKFNMKTEKLEK